MLTDAQAGQLLRILYAFGLRGEEPGAETDPTVRLIFSMVRPQMLRDAETWEAKVAAGARGGKSKAQDHNNAPSSGSSVCQAWRDATGTRLSKSTTVTLEKMASIYGAKTVEAAIEEAVMHGQVTLAYVQGVLRNWHEEERCLEEARARLTEETPERKIVEAIRPLAQRYGMRSLLLALEGAGPERRSLEELTAAVDLMLRTNSGK